MQNYNYFWTNASSAPNYFAFSATFAAILLPHMPHKRPKTIFFKKNPPKNLPVQKMALPLHSHLGH